MRRALYLFIEKIEVSIIITDSHSGRSLIASKNSNLPNDYQLKIDAPHIIFFDNCGFNRDYSAVSYEFDLYVFWG